MNKYKCCLIFAAIFLLVGCGVTPKKQCEAHLHVVLAANQKLGSFGTSDVVVFEFADVGIPLEWNTLYGKWEPTNGHGGYSTPKDIGVWVAESTSRVVELANERLKQAFGGQDLMKIQPFPGSSYLDFGDLSCQNGRLDRNVYLELDPWETRYEILEVSGNLMTVENFEATGDRISFLIPLDRFRKVLKTGEGLQPLSEGAVFQEVDREVIEGVYDREALSYQEGDPDPFIGDFVVPQSRWPEFQHLVSTAILPYYGDVEILYGVTTNIGVHYGVIVPSDYIP